MAASEPLPHFVDDLLGYLHETHPTHATLDGVHTHDDLLEDLSRQGLETETHALSGYLRRLDEIDAGGLTPNERLEHRMLAANLRGRMFELEDVRTWERNPQLYADIDRVKVRSMGLALTDVFDTLQVYLGGYYVNDFNRFGRTWQVNLQADAAYRDRIANLHLIEIRNNAGQMVSLGALADVREVGGPILITRNNLYTAAAVKMKPQSVTKDQAKGLVSYYIDARLAAERLTAAVGPGGWSEEYHVVSTDPQAGLPIECRLTVLGVTRADVGQIAPGPLDDKAWKSAYSDALKRAAVKWGIGRYLYRLPLTWHDYDAKKKQFMNKPALLVAPMGEIEN